MPFTFFHISKAKRNGLLARKKSKKVILVVYVQIRGGGGIFLLVDLDWGPILG